VIEHLFRCVRKGTIRLDAATPLAFDVSVIEVPGREALRLTADLLTSVSEHAGNARTAAIAPLCEEVRHVSISSVH
jgi:hypothetical protein